MEVLTTLVVVATVTLPPLDPTVVPQVVTVQTVDNNTQVESVVTDLEDLSTSTVVGATDMDPTIHMETTSVE